MTTTPPVSGRHYIHYDPDRTDYAVTADELHRLEDAGSNLWKDLCLGSLPFGIACLVNAIAATPSPFTLSLGLFLNYLIGGLGLLLGAAFAIAWRRSHKSLTKIVEEIKCKPKMQLMTAAVDVGALPPATVLPAPPAGPPSS